MATQAELALSVARQVLDFVGMINGRSVAVFAFDPAMRRTPQVPDILAVALGTGSVALVLDRKLLPLLDVAQPVKIIGKAFAVDTEVVRNKKKAGYEDKPYESNCNPQGVQYVSLHGSLPSCHGTVATRFNQYVNSVDACGAAENRLARCC
jgi:hypothetical protein